MKIHILYPFKDGPWGGANQFLKAVKEYFIKRESYTEKIVHWEGVRSLVCIENTRTDNKTGETTSENHYYITSLPMDAETILNVARKHWGIENNLHWQLDVSFNEDNQKKKNNAAQNISLVNKIALARIKQDETKGSTGPTHYFSLS